jgi:hypothetical protein
MSISVFLTWSSLLMMLTKTMPIALLHSTSILTKTQHCGSNSFFLFWRSGASPTWISLMWLLASQKVTKDLKQARNKNLALNRLHIGKCYAPGLTDSSVIRWLPSVTPAASFSLAIIREPLVRGRGCFCVSISSSRPEEGRCHGVVPGLFQQVYFHTTSSS